MGTKVSKPDLFKPEKFVEAQVLAWAFQRRWSLDLYNSIGQYSAAQGRYTRNKGMRTGTPDLMGASSQGYAVFLELKAPGKEAVCRLEQRAFLEAKIQNNAFALCVSDVSFLEETWNAWLKLRLEGKDKEARDLLQSLLPKKVLIKGKILTLG